MNIALWILIAISQSFAVPGEPQNVRARPVNSSSVEVTWDPPVDNDKNGVIRGYQIFVQPKNVSLLSPTLKTSNSSNNNVLL